MQKYVFGKAYMVQLDLRAVLALNAGVRTGLYPFCFLFGCFTFEQTTVLIGCVALGTLSTLIVTAACRGGASRWTRERK